MNASAHGQAISDILLEVDFLTKEGELRTLSKEKIHFGYRHSSFQDDPGLVIVGASFALMQDAQAKIRHKEFWEKRKNSQPLDQKSAGCVFRNPSTISAGALIDQCNLKGLKVGGAEVSKVHGNFIINTGNASCQDVLNLIEKIQKEVKAKMQIDLEEEIRCISFDRRGK